MKLVREVSRKGKFINLIPGILTGISIGSFFAAAFFSAEATPKAIKLMEREKRRREQEGEPEEMTTIEVIETTWTPYKKALIFLCIGTLTAIGGCAMHYQYAGALLAVGTAAERGYQEAKKVIESQKKEGDNYRKAVLDTVGEETEHQIVEKAKTYYPEPQRMEFPIDNTDGWTKMWFRDEATGQKIFTCVNDVYDVIRDMNIELEEGNEQSMDDYCYKMNLEPLSFGDNLKWTEGSIIKVKFGSKWLPDENTYIGTIKFEPGRGPSGRVLPR